MATPNTPNLIFPKADLSLATLQPYTVGADGSWTPVIAGSFAAGPLSLLGYIDSIIPDFNQLLMEAISVDAGYMNRIPTLLDCSVVVTENVKRQIGAGVSGSSLTDFGSLLALCVGYPAMQLKWVYNKTTAHQDTYTVYGTWERFTGGTVQGVGVQKAGIVIKLQDTSYTTVGGVAGILPMTIVRA